jgi:glycogen synthase
MNIYEELNSAIDAFAAALVGAGLDWHTKIEIPVESPFTVYWNHREDAWGFRFQDANKGWVLLANTTLQRRCEFADHTELITQTIISNGDEQRVRIDQAIKTLRTAAAELSEAEEEAL